MTHLAAGLGFKPSHLQRALAARHPGLWFEVHAENYMVDGGPMLRHLERVRERRPDARLSGITVQPMIRRSNARELMVGVVYDKVFGPLISFGIGGVAVEVRRPVAVGHERVGLEVARVGDGERPEHRVHDAPVTIR